MAQPHNSRSRIARPRPRKPTIPRKQAQQARSLALVEDLMRATTRLLIRDGYDALTTNRVAELAGVSIGSLYQYFPNKEALVAALLERHVKQTMRVLNGEFALLFALPVEQAAPRLVRAMIEMHRVDPALHRVLAEQLPRSGRQQGMQAGMLESIALTRLYLSQHQSEIAPRDLELAAFIVVNTVEALTHAAVIDRPELLARPELVDEISACVVRYLKGG
jgi:AcrR family transcriptional regulator